LNLATVDAYGCDYAAAALSIVPLFVWNEVSRGGVYYHIGVGSNVVCSTGLGNARAAVSGTGNRQFPRSSHFVGNTFEQLLFSVLGNIQSICLIAENMNKYWLTTVGKFLSFGLSIALLVSCSHKIATPDEKFLSEFYQQYDSDKPDVLYRDSLALYVDYSTCMAMGQSSPFFNALVPSFVDAAAKYYSIKGADITEERGSTFELLRTIQEVNYADLKAAIERMADRKGESALLTDGEYYQQNIAKGNINNPYMAQAFKKWLLRGHDIYIISEPYVETVNGRQYNKKRFYVLFTDSRMANNIWSRISETANLERFPNVSTYHLSIDHPQLYTSGGNCSQVNPSLAAKVKGFGNYEIQEWTVSWENAVFPLIMNNTMDANGKPLKHGDYICKGISVDRNSFGGYSINSVKAEMYSINQEYSDFVNKVKVNPTAPIGGIMIDEEEFKRHGNISLYFDQNFDENTVFTGSPYNYIRVDIRVCGTTDMFRRYIDNFVFDSIDVPEEKNTSIAESIKQCLAYPEVKEKAKNCPLYTYYIQSQEN